MISAVSRNISMYKPVQQISKAAIIQVEAVIAAEKSNQIARDAAVAKTIEDARREFLQTQYVGPARAAAQLAAQGSERQLVQYVDPTDVKKLQTDYQDLRSGCHAGPTPVSVITADAQYRKMLDIVA